MEIATIHMPPSIGIMRSFMFVLFCMSISSINPFTAVYKCTLYADENKTILMLLCDVTYNIIQNYSYWRDLHQISPCSRDLVQLLK